MLFFIIVALLSGGSIVMARIVNADLAKRIGIIRSTFWNYLSGFALAAILLLLSGELIRAAWGSSFTAPLWSYLGGLAGIIVIALSSFLTPRMSAFYLTILIFIGQLILGLLIDYLFLDKLSIGMVVGGCMVVAGMSYNLWLDSRGK